MRKQKAGSRRQERLVGRELSPREQFTAFCFLLSAFCFLSTLVPRPRSSRVTKYSAGRPGTLVEARASLTGGVFAGRQQVLASARSRKVQTSNVE
jgi:hypothetical protein